MISQVLIYFCMDYITLLTPLSTANRARPHSSKHNLSYRRCSSTGRAFWLHHCSFQTCVKFQGARRFTSYVRQQILTARRPPLPPPPSFVFLHEYNWPAASTPAAFLYTSARLDCPIQGFPPVAGKRTAHQTLTHQSNRRRTSEWRKSLTRQRAAAASGLFQAVKRTWQQHEG